MYVKYIVNRLNKNEYSISLKINNRSVYLFSNFKQLVIYLITKHKLTIIKYIDVIDLLRYEISVKQYIITI